MKIISTELEGLVVIEPKVWSDARGFLMETWQQTRYSAAGMEKDMVQDNLTRSSRGVLRGLHLQNPKEQAKLISVIVGEIFDVAVDLRSGSPTFAKWFGVLLSDENKRQIYVPPGYAHGFCVLSES